MEEFKPLPDDLRQRLRGLAEAAPAGSIMVLTGTDVRDEELQARGMIAGLHPYASGECRLSVTWRGAHYEQDLAEWERERAEAAALEAWKAGAEMAERAEREYRVFLHDWQLAVFGGACTLLGSLLTLISGCHLGG